MFLRYLSISLGCAGSFSFCFFNGFSFCVFCLHIFFSKINKTITIFVLHVKINGGGSICVPAPFRPPRNKCFRSTYFGLTRDFPQPLSRRTSRSRYVTPLEGVVPSHRLSPSRKEIRLDLLIVTTTCFYVKFFLNLF